MFLLRPVMGVMMISSSFRENSRYRRAHWDDVFSNDWALGSANNNTKALPAASYYDKTATGLGFAVANKVEDESWSWTH